MPGNHHPRRVVFLCELTKRIPRGNPLRPVRWKRKRGQRECGPVSSEEDAVERVNWSTPVAEERHAAVSGCATSQEYMEALLAQAMGYCEKKVREEKEKEKEEANVKLDLDAMD